MVMELDSRPFTGSVACRSFTGGCACIAGASHNNISCLEIFGHFKRLITIMFRNSTRLAGWKAFTYPS